MPSLNHSLLSYLRAVTGAWRDDPRDDAELLARFAESSDEAAFKTLVGRHGPLVWRTCARLLGEGPDAEDAFQTVFLALAHQAGRLRREALAGWLYRVARRAALKVDVEAKRRQNLEQHLRAVSPSEASAIDRDELYAALDVELAGLPEQLRVPLLLFYLEGKSQIEVARFLDCSRNVVQYRLARGEAVLRKRLERRGLAVGISSVGVLLGSTVTAPAVSARLIGSTARAAVAFRSGTLTGGAVEAARAVSGALPSPLAGTFMWKSLWIVLACCLGLGGAALVTCQALTARLNEPGGTGLAVPLVDEQTGQNGAKQERTDLYGDPLPQGALARLGTTRLRHSPHVVIPLSFSRDDKTLVTVGRHDTVRWWEVATGKEIRNLKDSNLDSNLKDYTDVAAFAAFSPDGKIVATGGGVDKTVRLWDVATGKEIRSLQGKEEVRGVRSVAFSPDGKIVAMSGDMHAWDKRLRTVRRTAGIVRLWEVATGKEIRTLQSKEDVRSVALSPDGKTVAMGFVADEKIAQDGWEGVHLWETATGKLIRTLQVRPPQNNGQISLVAFSPGGKILATAGSDGIIRLWEVATGKEIRTLQEAKGCGSRSMTFAPDGKTLAAVVWDGKVRLWEVATGKETQTPQGHKVRVDEGRYVRSAVFSSDGKTLATGANDGVVHLWETATGKPILMPKGHEGLCLKAAFTPDGKTVVTSGADETVRLWEAATGKEIRTLRANTGQVWDGGVTTSPVALSLDGKIVAAGDDKIVHLWEAATGKEIRTLQGLSTVMAVAFAPDGKTLASGESENPQNGTVRLWEVSTGKEIRTLKLYPQVVYSVAFSPDGKMMASGESNGIVRLWQVSNAEEIRTLQVKGWAGNQPPITSVAFSPDGLTVASGQDNGMVRLWGTSSGKEIRTLQGFTGERVRVEVAFSQDGRTLAASSGHCVRLWDLLSGTVLPSLTGHQAPVCGVAFSPNGMALASVSADSTGLIWDLTYGADRPETKPGPDALEALWVDLASKDGARAKRTVWTLAAMPAQSVPLLRDRLRPVPADRGKRLARLIADLDANEFQVRQKAYRALEETGPDAEPALRKGLEGHPSVELRKRLQQLLEAVGEQNRRGFSGEGLRGLRAVEVLERIGTPEARQVLQTLAAGASAFLTQEAQAALRRLEGVGRPPIGPSR